MGKKKKTKPRRPPLSLLDRGIYAAGCGLCCAVWLGLSFLSYFLGEVAATRDASVIAYTRGASSVLCLPWALYLCLPLFLWLRGKWESSSQFLGPGNITMAKRRGRRIAFRCLTSAGGIASAPGRRRNGRNAHFGCGCGSVDSCLQRRWLA